MMPAPVISVAQMRDWEKASWAAGRTESEVIGRVGEAVAERVGQRAGPGELVGVVAGKGHNGDDARAAMEHLTNGRVHLLNIKDPETGGVELERLLEQKP